MGGNNEFFENFERNKYLKKLPSMQRVKNSISSRIRGYLKNKKEMIKLKLNNGQF